MNYSKQWQQFGNILNGFILLVLLFHLAMAPYFQSVSSLLGSSSSNEKSIQNLILKNTEVENLSFYTSKNLNEVSSKIDAETFNSIVRRRISSVSENPNRFPQSLTLGVLGLRSLTSEQILCISFFGKRNEEELTDLDMRAIQAVLKVEDEIKVAPLTRAEAKDSSILLQVEVKALYESKLRELLLKGISKELFERVRRKILDEPKDSTQSEQSGVSERDQVLADQLSYTNRFKNIIAKYIKDYPELINLGVLDKNRKADLLKKSIKDEKMDLLEALLNFGIDPDFYDSEGDTALITAVRNRDYKATEFILKFNANINLPSKHNEFDYPILQDTSKEIFNLLLSYKPDLKIRNSTGNTPFLFAVPRYSLDEIIILKDQGASITDTNDHGRSALSLALYNKKSDPKVIEWLIDQGLDVNSEGEGGVTPLLLALKNANIEALKILIQNGANVNHRDGKSRPAFFHYIFDYMKNSVDNPNMLELTNQVITLLIDNNWNPFLLDNNGRSAREICDRTLMTDHDYIDGRPIPDEINRIKIFLVKAELEFIKKNGLDSIQELNDTEKVYYNDLLEKIKTETSHQEKERIIRKSALEDLSKGVQK